MAHPPDDTAPLTRTELSEKVVKDAIQRLDWPALREHLDEVGLSADTFASLIGYLQRSNSLIITHPDAARELRRMIFVGSLRELVIETIGMSASDDLLATIDLILRIEEGYRSILDRLDRSDISRLSPEARVGACISRSVAQYAEVMQRADRALTTGKDISLSEAPYIPLDDGGQLSADAIVEGLLTALTLSLGMEARRNGWIDATRRIVLPPLPDVGDEERFKAGSTELLAMCWVHWRRTEERRRFLGGTLDHFVSPELPSWAPPGVRQLTTYKPETGEIFDHIANERLRDRFGQTLADMAVETNAALAAKGIDGEVALLPHAWVSLSEAHSAISLSEILSYDIGCDQERPGGLRLVEWLRGYATLSVLAEQRSDPSDPDSLVFSLSMAELKSVLTRCGLSDQAASRFLDAASLTTSSRDMFDAPLVRRSDGTMMTFAPALLHTNHARIVLSAIGSLGEPLSRKGSSFERATLSLFEAQSLAPKSFTARRDGEEYQYDTIVVWDDYVFVFECKNYTLSGHHPIQAYYFQLQMRSAARQVTRLAKALREHPSIMLDTMGVDISSKRLVACVLNAMPYALPSDHDGVYFADASGIRRFFKERYFHLKTPFSVDQNVTLLLRTAMYAMWKADKPTAEDFLRYLADPFQVRLLGAHTAMRSKSFTLGEGHLVAADEFERTPLTVESYANAVGVSADAIQRERSDVANRVAGLRASREKRTDRE